MAKRRSFYVLVLAMLLLLGALPAAAAEPVERMPAMEPFHSARFELALVLNDQVMVVGKGEMATPERIHFVMKTMPMEYLPEKVFEMVVYDGTIYTREDDDPQWYIEDDSVAPAPAPVSHDPDNPEDVNDVIPVPDDLSIMHMGEKEIAGTPTDQYQIWLNDLNADGNPKDYAKVDFWLGQAIAYLYQLQLSVFDNDPELGDLKVEMVFRFEDHEDHSIVVGPPANAIPRDYAAHGLMDPIAGRGMLSSLSAPLAAPQLRELAEQALKQR